MRTRRCGLLGIDHPILNAPMAMVAGAPLAAAVSGSGGLGLIVGAHVLAAVALDEGIPVVAHSFADPTPFVAPAHDAGALVLCQVRTVAEAERAATAGVDVIVAQGTEGGRPHRPGVDAAAGPGDHRRGGAAAGVGGRRHR